MSAADEKKELDAFLKELDDMPSEGDEEGWAAVRAPPAVRSVTPSDAAKSEGPTPRASRAASPESAACHVSAPKVGEGKSQSMAGGGGEKISGKGGLVGESSTKEGKCPKAHASDGPAAGSQEQARSAESGPKAEAARGSDPLQVAAAPPRNSHPASSPAPKLKSRTPLVLGKKPPGDKSVAANPAVSPGADSDAEEVGGRSPASRREASSLQQPPSSPRPSHPPHPPPSLGLSWRGFQSLGQTLAAAAATAAADVATLGESLQHAVAEAVAEDEAAEEALREERERVALTQRRAREGLERARLGTGVASSEEERKAASRRENEVPKSPGTLPSSAPLSSDARSSPPAPMSPDDGAKTRALFDSLSEGRPGGVDGAALKAGAALSSLWTWGAGLVERQLGADEGLERRGSDKRKKAADEDKRRGEGPEPGARSAPASEEEDVASLSSASATPSWTPLAALGAGAARWIRTGRQLVEAGAHELGGLEAREGSHPPFSSAAERPRGARAPLSFQEAMYVYGGAQAAEELQSTAGEAGRACRRVRAALSSDALRAALDAHLAGLAESFGGEEAASLSGDGEEAVVPCEAGALASPALDPATAKALNQGRALVSEAARAGLLRLRRSLRRRADALAPAAPAPGGQLLGEVAALGCERLLALARSVLLYARHGRAADDGIRWPADPRELVRVLDGEVAAVGALAQGLHASIVALVEGDAEAKGEAMASVPDAEAAPAPEAEAAPVPDAEAASAPDAEAVPDAEAAPVPDAEAASAPDAEAVPDAESCPPPDGFLHADLRVAQAHLAECRRALVQVALAAAARSFQRREEACA